jgi:hypothetical protein
MTAGQQRKLYGFVASGLGDWLQQLLFELSRIAQACALCAQGAIHGDGAAPARR